MATAFGLTIIVEEGRRPLNGFLWWFIYTSSSSAFWGLLEVTSGTRNFYAFKQVKPGSGRC